MLTGSDAIGANNDFLFVLKDLKTVLVSFFSSCKKSSFISFVHCIVGEMTNLRAFCLLLGWSMKRRTDSVYDPVRSFCRETFPSVWSQTWFEPSEPPSLENKLLCFALGMIFRWENLTEGEHQAEVWRKSTLAGRVNKLLLHINNSVLHVTSWALKVSLTVWNLSLFPQRIVFICELLLHRSSPSAPAKKDKNSEAKK